MSWQIDYAHSTISFSVRHLMIARVRGRFNSFSGTINFDEDNPINTTVKVTIDANSISTNDEQRDNHLRSPDFLDVERFPTLSFQSKRVEQIDEGRGRLIGDLTVRDMTREVALDVEYHGQAKTPWGTMNAGFAASTTLVRKDWELNWNAALETGGFLVGDEVKIEIELELVKQAVPA